MVNRVVTTSIAETEAQTGTAPAAVDTGSRPDGEAAEGNEAVVYLPSLSPEVLAPPRKTGGATLLSLAAAVLVHVAVITLTFPGRQIERVGAGGRELDAIEVVMVRLDAAPASAAAPTTEGAASDARNEVAETKRRTVEEAAPDSTQPSDIAATTPVPAESADVEPATDDEQDVTSTEQSRVSSAAAQSGDEITTPPVENAAAAAGVARDYARSVMAALSANRPRPIARQRGTVVIAFIVTQDGKLGSSRVAKSSGLSTLDEAALNALRRTQFPVPPPGLSARELDFQIPYLFR